MPLTVLNVAYPFAPIGPDSVGGAEQILTHLDRALIRAGHRSIVIAREGSQAAGTLLSTRMPPGTLTDELRQRIQREHRARIQGALDRYRIDLIHMHGIDFDAYLPRPGVPVLVTLHLPPAWYNPSIFHLDRPDTHLHCVSSSQHRACPPAANLLPPIANGVPIDGLSFHCTKRRFALALGRICPEKNLHTALDAGRLGGIPVLLGGQVFPYPAHQQYYREQILPRLDNQRRFLGPLTFRRKRRLLSAARCLLLPSLAPETSSLVVMESLACGTPVVAFPSGALPELIEHGATGFLVSSLHEMADAIETAAHLDPDVCRATARRCFPLQRMIDRYFAVYHRLVQTRNPVACQAMMGGQP